MSTIFKRGQHEKENEGFSVFDLISFEEEEKEIETDSNFEAKTVFERVALKEEAKKTEFKYRKYLIMAVTGVIILSLILFGCFLSLYEKNSPNAFCESVVNTLTERNPDLFLKYCTNLPDVLKNRENLEKYLNSYLPNDEYKFFPVASQKNKTSYIFKVEDKQVASITFKEKSKKGAFGITEYKIESFELKPLTTYVLHSYSSFELLVNGKPLPEKYLFSQSGVNYSFKEFYGSTMTKDIYSIEDLFYIADISALDKDKKPVDVVTSISISETEITLSPEGVEEKLSEFLRSYTEKYMYYTVKDDRRPKPLLELIYPNTALYEEIKQYKNSDTTKFSDEKIKNLTVDDLVYYGSGCYTCKVKADYEVVVNKKSEIRKFDKKLYLCLKDGKFYVMDMV